MRFKNKKTGERVQSNWNLLDLCAGTNTIELVAEKTDIRTRRKDHASLDSDYERYHEINAIKEEYDTLRELIATESTTPTQLLRYLRDPDHSDEFYTFAKEMCKRNPMKISEKYRAKAEELAESNNLYVDQKGKIIDTYNAATYYTALKKADIKEKGKHYAPVIALAVAAALAVGGVAAAISHHNTHSGGSEDPYEIETTVDADEIEVTESDTSDTFVPPISTIGKVSTYEKACDAFYNMLSEIYEYNTGEEIDLSDSTQSSMSYNKDATEYVVTYQGKTYYFSAVSPYRTNSENLKKALVAVAGEENVTSQKTSIYSIADQTGTSIAITDSDGNAVKSGKVMVTSNGGRN